jgi:hypothetical protein
MALESTQTLTGIDTRNLAGLKGGQRALKADHHHLRADFLGYVKASTSERRPRLGIGTALSFIVQWSELRVSQCLL